MSQGTVLIVEDDKDIRETVQLALELEGYRTIGAENGKQGLEILQNSERPCVVLLDLMMPVMNGWEFLKTLRKDPDTTGASSVPVVIVSAARQDVPKDQYSEFIKKPVDIGDLLGAVSRYCGEAGLKQAS